MRDPASASDRGVLRSIHTNIERFDPAHVYFCIENQEGTT